MNDNRTTLKDIACDAAAFLSVSAFIICVALACVYSLQGSAMYAKFVVDSVDLPGRRLFVRHVIDGNCGFKSLVPDSIPTF